MTISESDLMMPALRCMAASKGGFITTTQLIAELEAVFQPSGLDAELLAGRSDTHFSQKVRNLVSHRTGSTGLEARGLATYDDKREGWSITERGHELIAAAP